MLRRALNSALATSLTSSRSVTTATERLLPAWVFLGPPGVGKGTYATRIAEWLCIPHVAAGDLVRDEIKAETPLGLEMKSIVNAGNLLPDEVVIRLLRQRLHTAADAGDPGVLLDGFPRTVSQASNVLHVADVQLALNMQLREDVLMAKCLGRRVCTKCGKGYNVADINLPAANGEPAIVMPPLNPPPECMQHLETRADDTEAVVTRRLQVYHAEAAPVEEFFRNQGLLVDFEITGGIPETLPRLQALLGPYADKLGGGAAQAAA